MRDINCLVIHKEEGGREKTTKTTAGMCRVMWGEEDDSGKTDQKVFSPIELVSSINKK